MSIKIEKNSPRKSMEQKDEFHGIVIQLGVNFKHKQENGKEITRFVALSKEISVSDFKEHKKYNFTNPECEDIFNLQNQITKNIKKKCSTLTGREKILLDDLRVMLCRNEKMIDAKRKGQIGEEYVAKELKRLLPEEDYIIFNDLILPACGRTTQIDHIIVSRFGIFVIETKNMQGWILMDDKYDEWIQMVEKHRTTEFQNPLRQNFKHIKAVQKLFKIKENQVHNLVVFVGTATPCTEMPEDIYWKIEDLADRIQKSRTVVFSESQFIQFSDRLGEEDIQATEERKQVHLRQFN